MNNSITIIDGKGKGVNLKKKSAIFFLFFFLKKKMAKRGLVVLILAILASLTFADDAQCEGFVRSPHIKVRIFFFLI